MKSKLVNNFIIGTFVALYLLVSIISTIHVVDFFEMSNPRWMAITLAIGFELGAAASLASLITLDKMNKTLVWSLFIVITGMQMQGNMYYAFKNLADFSAWSELFNLIEEDLLYQKRIIAAVSGAILPLIALGFIKSLVDYIKPDGEIKEETIEETPEAPGKIDDLTDEEKNVSWGRYSEDCEWDDEEVNFFNDEEGPYTFETDVEVAEIESQQDELGLESFDDNWGNYLSNDSDFGEIFDEDHALDIVLNHMVDGMDVEDILTEEEFDEYQKSKQDLDDIKINLTENDVEVMLDANENPTEPTPSLTKAVEDYKEIVKPKEPVNNVDEAFRFGTNLYNTMLQKLNSDHLPKPSVEQVTNAYKNLGLVKNPK